MSHQRMKIGVMGSASGPTIENPENIKKARLLGRHIARRNCILINGACPGLPDHAAAGARAAGGFVFGVSPAFSRAEHLHTYRSPIEHYDLILYTGMGLMERDIINIRSSDGVILIGGGVGTLNEFTVAFEERKVVGVLAGTGGVSNHVAEIVRFCDRKIPPDRLIFDPDPRRLVDKIVRAVRDHAPPTHETEIGGEKEREAEKRAASAAKDPKRLRALRSQKRRHDRTYA